jgi:hypothetical protein
LVPIIGPREVFTATFVVVVVDTVSEYKEAMMQ